MPAWEVVSIRPHVPHTGFHQPDCVGDRFIAAGTIFGNVIRWAYAFPGGTNHQFDDGVRATGISGRFFDIQAKADGPIANSQCRLMVQALLADRFKLAYHWETRTGEISDLVVARGGPKIRKVLAADQGTDVNIVHDGRLVRSRAPGPDPVPKGLTMRELADYLTISAPPDMLWQVIDKTGLEGRYMIDLRFSDALPTNNEDPLDPSLDAALAEQLGLRLEKHKGPIKVPVLDHIEAPSPN